MCAVSSILIIDDEENLRSSLSLIFRRAGHSITSSATLEEARHCLTSKVFDLVFLDLHFLGQDGLKLIQEIHELCPELPVLILVAQSNLDTAIQAVHQGARDYLLKPADPSLILSRMQEILAEQGSYPLRTDSTDTECFIQCGPINLDLHARHVTLNDQFIPLSKTAFDFLLPLVTHSPDPVSAEMLVFEAQGLDLGRSKARKLARLWIHRLRRSIEPDLREPRYIITVRDFGYQLIP